MNVHPLEVALEQNREEERDQLGLHDLERRKVMHGRGRGRAKPRVRRKPQIIGLMAASLATNWPPVKGDKDDVGPLCPRSGVVALFKEMDISSLDIADFLAIGAIFSATDSVCTLQGGLLVLNYIIKKLYIGRHSTDREVALTMLMAYLSYMLAELLDLSGILTVFFCGIVMSHYTWHNVTESSRITTKHAFATFFFLYVGMDALDIEKWRFVFGLMTKPLMRFLLPHSLKHFSNMPSDPSTRKAFLWQLIENGHGLEGEVGEHIAQPPTEDSFFRL
ncbi:hypothetical protein ZIOFF_004253 [Zingiber officinale]|uniref:Cation/H+ exchanger transmembrane domain-containing protein n=1 Tax=Zingiber officinale TaxID=94328 RepID=A0A8J5MB43_ZINOF|nr:hypothetical protein ZIOFF_004253 [Zingiber officinale]